MPCHAETVKMDKCPGLWGFQNLLNQIQYKKNAILQPSEERSKYNKISKISHINVKTKRVVKAPSRSQYNEG
jgi:hypothetical protein